MRRCSPVKNLIIPLCTAMLLSACAGLSHPQPDRVEAVLPVPESQVRVAVLQVIREGGYTLTSGGATGAELSTGLRQETNNPSDWLISARFGISRTHMDIVLSPEGDSATRLAIQVLGEGKDGLFESWQPYDPPLAQSAANQLRLIRNALGLL